MDLTFNLNFIKMTAVKCVKVTNGNLANTCLSAATFVSAGEDRKNTSRVAYGKGFCCMLSETFVLRKPPLEYRGQNFFEQHLCQSDLYLVHVHVTCTTYAVFHKQFSSNTIYLKDFDERYPHNPLGKANLTNQSN